MLEVLESETRDVLDAPLVQYCLPERFQVLLVIYPERYIRELLAEAQVAVPGEASVAALTGEAFHGLVVETQVEDRIHHAGHGDGRPRAHGDQQRVVRVAQSFAGHRFEAGLVFVDSLDEIRRELATVLEVTPGLLGRDGVAGRHRQAVLLSAERVAVGYGGHLGHARPLTAQKLPAFVPAGDEHPLDLVPAEEIDGLRPREYLLGASPVVANESSLLATEPERLAHYLRSDLYARERVRDEAVAVQRRHQVVRLDVEEVRREEDYGQVVAVLDKGKGLDVQVSDAQAVVERLEQLPGVHLAGELDELRALGLAPGQLGLQLFGVEGLAPQLAAQVYHARVELGGRLPRS